MRNAFLTFTLQILSIPGFAQSTLIEVHRPNLNKSSLLPLNDLPTQIDELGTNLAVCLLIIGVYFLFWLKQKA